MVTKSSPANTEEKRHRTQKNPHIIYIYIFNNNAPQTLKRRGSVTFRLASHHRTCSNKHESIVAIHTYEKIVHGASILKTKGFPHKSRSFLLQELSDTRTWPQKTICRNINNFNARARIKIFGSRSHGQDLGY